jgi:hypothetical protein
MEIWQSAPALVAFVDGVTARPLARSPELVIVLCEALAIVDITYYSNRRHHGRTDLEDQENCPSR